MNIVGWKPTMAGGDNVDAHCLVPGQQFPFNGTSDPTPLPSASLTPPVLDASASESTFSGPEGDDVNTDASGRKGDPHWVARPRNKFMIFRCEYARIHAGDGRQRKSPGGHAGDTLSKRAGQAWKALSLEQQRHWQHRADLEREEHARKNPHYRYRPNKNKPGNAASASRRSHTSDQGQPALRRVVKALPSVSVRSNPYPRPVVVTESTTSRPMDATPDHAHVPVSSLPLPGASSTIFSPVPERQLGPEVVQSLSSSSSASDSPALAFPPPSGPPTPGAGTYFDYSPALLPTTTFNQGSISPSAHLSPTSSLANWNGECPSPTMSSSSLSSPTIASPWTPYSSPSMGSLGSPLTAANTAVGIRGSFPITDSYPAAQSSLGSPAAGADGGQSQTNSFYFMIDDISSSPSSPSTPWEFDLCGHPTDGSATAGGMSMCQQEAMYVSPQSLTIQDQGMVLSDYPMGLSSYGIVEAASYEPMAIKIQ